MKPIYRTTAQVVDDLGQIAAQLASLRDQERALKDLLISRGEGAYEGELYRATVSRVERSNLDMGAVRDKLSPQFITAHTSTTVYGQVRVVARKGGQ